MNYKQILITAALEKMEKSKKEFISEMIHAGVDTRTIARTLVQKHIDAIMIGIERVRNEQS